MGVVERLANVPGLGPVVEVIADLVSLVWRAVTKTSTGENTGDKP